MIISLLIVDIYSMSGSSNPLTVHHDRDEISVQSGARRQHTFRTRTRVGGSKPKLGDIRLPFRRRKPGKKGLDSAKRYMHVLTDAIVFEVEGEEDCLVVSSVATATNTTSIGSTSELTFSSKLRSSLRLTPGSPDFVSTTPVEGVFGFYSLPSGPYVAAIARSKVKFAEPALGLEYRQMSKVLLRPITQRAVQLREEDELEEERQLQLLRQAFTSHQFFFSHAHDITHTLQRLCELGEQGVKPPAYKSSDERFFWNKHVLEPLISHYEANGEGAEAAESWILPVTSAFFQVEEGCTVGDHSFNMLFVSRRSCMRQGTRYTRRGIDECGNVANFVETEQALLHSDGQVTSHVQIRGSIPLFWSSPVNLHYTPPVRLWQNDTRTAEALRLHALELADLYGAGPRSLVFVNLIDKKKDQGRLGDAMDSALAALRSDAEWPYPPNAIEHVWFDFHKECKDEGGWSNLDKLLKEVDAATEEHGYFHATGAATDQRNRLVGHVLRRQKGVVRTNCMDCLDRTNVVQSLLARRSLLSQLKAVGADVPSPNSINDSDTIELATAIEEGSVMTVSKKGNDGLGEGLESRFRDVWGNNADEIAVLYAGTPALKGDFTRTGRRTKAGALLDGVNSITRYWVNNFLDPYRQEAINMLLKGRCEKATVHDTSTQTGTLIGRHPPRIDLDMWTRFTVPSPTHPSGPIEGAVLIGIRRKIEDVDANMDFGDYSSEEDVLEGARVNIMRGPSVRSQNTATPVDYARASLVALTILALRAVAAGKMGPGQLSLFVAGLLVIPFLGPFD